MKDFELRYVGSHVEVYTGSGVFLFSADTVREAMEELGFRTTTRREDEAGLVVSLLYPDDPAWDFEKIHDYCYARGYTIYPGKLARKGAFRLCSLGALQPQDARDFLAVFREALAHFGVRTPMYYRE